jgi:hypothetical protein
VRDISAPLPAAAPILRLKNFVAVIRQQAGFLWRQSLIDWYPLAHCVTHCVTQKPNAKRIFFDTFPKRLEVHSELIQHGFNLICHEFHFALLVV